MIYRISLTCLAWFLSFAVQSAPAFLITHNTTDVLSNAYIIKPDGTTTPSPYPTPAKYDGKIYWNLVKLACHNHSVGTICSAMIKMAPNTPNPIEVGVVAMDTETGEITPKVVSGNGYTVTVNGLGETTITQP